jgi:hypothetical protein
MPRVQMQGKKSVKFCLNCGKEILGDESAIYRKLVSKTAENYLCIPCLAKHFNCKEKNIYDLINFYRENKICALFK